MLKYLYAQVYTKEVPNELSLGLSILGCPIHCPECHSPHIWDTGNAVGTELTVDELDRLISSQSYVSCILFLGGDWDLSLSTLVETINKEQYKVALYSGHNLDYCLSLPIATSLDYLKVGHYDHRLGGLSYPSTNQRLYTMKDGKVIKDITSLFWKTNIG